jgi:chromate reductase
MTTPHKVAVLIGSLREGSFSRRVAGALVKLAPASLTFEIIEIGDLPLYNQDLDPEGATPPAWTRFREAVAPLDAVLFVTPEYNRSVPAALKNAIDVGSRPYGKSVWNGKPAAVVSVSPGGLGGFGANHHLRQSLVFLNMPMLNQPEAYISHAADLVADDGTVPVEATREFLRGLMTAFGRWVALIAGAAI